ncbi:Cof-type HAD-IIB family hydrolase [Gorillibacterium sp. sgz5001074]|uniref:Cof-type HAD-IIB family hydrolase n=1 Tax=Gorillibacterium sp. sgz5001074 TaxID=3446695 RepID=UPI003F67E04C
MSMPYRLIALDVDGTLLNDAHELTPGTKEAVRAAAEAGAEIVLCTGRGASNAFYLLEEMGLSGMLITHNGATTVRSEDRGLVQSFAYPLDRIRNLLDYCRKEGIHYDANSVYELFADRISPEAEAMYARFGITPVKLDDIYSMEGLCYKVSLFGTPEQLDRLDQVWDTLECPMVPIRSDARFTDIMHPDASKGHALRKLAVRMGIPREQILAVGNYFNDIDMLRFAGLGVAMANSPEEVKQAADEVTLSNNEEGVRAVLMKHLRGAVG